MGIGVSVFLIAAGAILAFAVDATVQGVSLVAIGWILMVVGVVGLVWALITAAASRDRREPARRDVIHEEPGY
jgi:protein-S-isoprenylcysteine O-methyltransferase Ste14